MTDVLIHTEGRVLAAIDPSASATGVVDHAAWAAARLGAPLDLLHAIERPVSTQDRADMSGSLSLDSREALLEELAALDEQRGRVAQRHGRLLLEQARDRARAATGIAADLHQRHGSLTETLLEAEPGVRLFVLGTRGERHAATGGGPLGDQVEQVLRSVNRPVLLVPSAFRRVQRFLIAFDGSDTARRSVELVCASPLLTALDCDVLSVGGADSDATRTQPWALARLQAAGFTPVPHMVAGHAETAIVAMLASCAADLLVMGAYGHSRIRRLIMGSTTTQVLRAATVPVLLLR